MLFDFDIIIEIYKFIFRHSNLGKIFCKYRKLSIPGMMSVKINWEPLFAQTIRIRDAAANVCAAETAQIVITCLIDMVGNRMIQLEHYFYPHFRLREQRDKATSLRRRSLPVESRWQLVGAVDSRESEKSASVKFCEKVFPQL